MPHPKPAPDIVLAFAAATGVDPSDIAVVGDNRYDMEMARAAGAGAAIGVLTGNSGEDDLAAYADVVLPSIRELPGRWRRGRRRDPTRRLTTTPSLGPRTAGSNARPWKRRLGWQLAERKPKSGRRRSRQPVCFRECGVGEGYQARAFLE